MILPDKIMKCSTKGAAIRKEPYSFLIYPLNYLKRATILLQHKKATAKMKVHLELLHLGPFTSKRYKTDVSCKQ